jgi:tRNA G18 (ribose-2'-O)-methylase SpoU
MTVDFRKLIEETEMNGYAVRDEYKTKTLEELKEITKSDRLPFSVFLFNVTGSLNVGTMIRTAHALGAGRVFVFGRKKFDKRSCVGSHNYLDIISIDSDSENEVEQYYQFYGIMEYYKLNPIMIETGGKNYTEYNWKGAHEFNQRMEKQICLVLGNEGLGIPKMIHQYAAHKVSIPQRGVIRSINVSNAFSIVCAHMVNEITKE